MGQAAFLEWTSWSGQKALRLEAAGYTATLVPSMGANVISLQRTLGNRQLDILCAPLSAEALRANPYAFGVPVLFPANRVSGGQYAWDGVRYEFPINRPNNVHIHGVLSNREWPVERCEAAEGAAHVSLCLDTERDAALKSHFPLPLAIRLDIELGSDGLTHRFSIINRSGEKAFPAGLAYHSAFRVDFCGSAEGVRLHVPIARRCLDDPVDMLPSGETRELDDFEAAIASNEGADPLGRRIDGLFTAAPGKPEMLMRNHLSGVEVAYHAGPENRYWTVYNRNARENYVAVEPQTWLSNAMNMPDPLHHNAVLVPPGGTWSSMCRISARQTAR